MMLDGMSDLPREEHELGMRLLAERPLPPASTRGRLSRAVGEHDAASAHLGWAATVVPAVLGLLLLAVAALGVAGIGPVAP
jgi:hypothetical protein